MSSPPLISRQKATFQIAEPTEPTVPAAAGNPAMRRRSGAIDLTGAVRQLSESEVKTSKVNQIAKEFEEKVEEERRSVSRNHSPTQPGPLLARRESPGNVTRRWTPPAEVSRERTPPQQKPVRHASPEGPVAKSPFIQSQQVIQVQQPSVPPLNLEGKKERRKTTSPSSFRIPLVRSTSASAVANAAINPKASKTNLGGPLGKMKSEEKQSTVSKEKERTISPTGVGRSVSYMPERKGIPTSPTRGESVVRSPTSLDRSISRTKSQRHIFATKNEAGIFDGTFINRKWHSILKEQLKEKSIPFDSQYFDGLIKTTACSLVDQALNLKVDSQDLAISTKLNAIYDLVKTVDDTLFLKPLRDKITEVHRILIEFLQDHKPTKEINEYSDLVGDLVVANNLREILAALRKHKHAISLFQLISGNEKLDIIQVLQKWEEEDFIRSQTERLAIDLYRRVNGFLRDLGNKKFVFEEKILEKKPTKIISRDDICRTFVPGDGDTVQIRVKGKCNLVPFNEAISPGSLKNQKDYREIYFYHLFYMLNKVGFNSQITDEELEAQVTSFLADYVNPNPTDLNKFLPFETLLQLASMAGWGRNDTLFRSTFPKLSHLANMPTSPRHNVYLTRTVPEKANPETVVEIVNRDNYSVVRSKYYSIHNYYKDSCGILMPKDQLAEFITEWTATVDLTTNLGLPVRTLKIKEFKFSNKATYEERIDIIKNLMETQVILPS